MNKSQYILFVTLFFVQTACIHAGKTAYVSSTFYKKEVINGIEFVYEERTENGVFQMMCMVAGKKVPFKEYEKERIEAELIQLAHDRKAEYKKRADDFEEKRSASVHILKKLVTLHLDAVKKMLEQIQSQKLQNYLVFNAKTFSSSLEFNSQIQEILTKAQELIDESVNDADIEKMKMIEQKLDQVVQRLHTLIHESINNAIKNCDDPRMLKELLIMIEAL